MSFGPRTALVSSWAPSRFRYVSKTVVFGTVAATFRPLSHLIEGGGSELYGWSKVLDVLRRPFGVWPMEQGSFDASLREVGESVVAALSGGPGELICLLRRK